MNYDILASFKSLFSIIRLRPIWSIKLFKVTTSIHDSLTEKLPSATIRASFIRSSLRWLTICADPFLFSENNKVYLFYEGKSDNGLGEIYCAHIDAITLNPISTQRVLVADYHLSYPQVFRYRGEIYMLPETSQSGSCRIFRAITFPTQWEECCEIISLPLKDPTILILDKIYIYGYLDGSANWFVAQDLLGPYTPYSLDFQPVSSELVRSAGPFISYEDSIYRPCQLLVSRYGEGLAITRLITESHPCFFPVAEELIAMYKPYSLKDRYQGGIHHISVVRSHEGVIMAVDGYDYDHLLNNLLLGLFRIYKVLTQCLNKFWRHVLSETTIQHM